MEYYAKLLNEVAKEFGIDEIYYYDFLEDRENNNATYEDIANLLEDYVYINDLGKIEIYAPSLLVMKNGKIILFDKDLNFNEGKTNPRKYFNENYEIKKSQIKMALNMYIGGMNERKD